MKKYLFFLIIAIAFCSSCQHKANNKEAVANDTIVEEPAFRVINFTEDLTDCGKPLVLSDIVDNVEYLKLETTEKGFIAGILGVKMSDKYVILTSFMVDHALLFDRVTGKFIRTIGKVGQGPGELLSPCYVGIQNDSIVYISSTYTYALFAHKITGEFIKKIPLEPNVQYPTMNFVDDYIIHYPGNANITGLYANVYVQDWDGNVIQESVHQFPGKFTENLWVNLPIVWTYKGIHNVFSCATDTVYAVTKDSIYPRYYIPEGKYKREICDRHTKVNWDFFTDAIQLGSIAETKDFCCLVSICIKSTGSAVTISTTQKSIFGNKTAQNPQKHLQRNRWVSQTILMVITFLYPDSDILTTGILFVSSPRITPMRLRR